MEINGKLKIQYKDKSGQILTNTIEKIVNNSSSSKAVVRAMNNDVVTKDKPFATLFIVSQSDDKFQLIKDTEHDKDDAIVKLPSYGKYLISFDLKVTYYKGDMPTSRDDKVIIIGGGAGIGLYDEDMRQIESTPHPSYELKGIKPVFAASNLGEEGLHCFIMAANIDDTAVDFATIDGYISIDKIQDE